MLWDATRLSVEVFYKDYYNFPINPTQPTMFLFDQVQVYGLFWSQQALEDNGRANAKGIEVILAPALEAQKITEISGKDLSIHLLAVVEGSIITAKSHRNPQFLRDGIARFKHYLNLLLKNKGVEKESTRQ